MDPIQSLLTQTAQMVANCRAQGFTPLCFIVGQEPVAQLKRELEQAAARQKSALARLLEKLRSKNPVGRVVSLHGLPVFENAELPGIFLQVAPRIVNPPGQAAAPGAPLPDFQEKIQANAGGDAPTIADMAKGDGLTPSAILMKGFEGIERVKHLIVIRAYDNEDVDMCLTCDSFCATGMLQKAHAWLMTRG